MQSKVWDVIVAGAGPSGSVCAQRLAEAGHEVLMLERSAAPGISANCTGIIGEEAFEVFELPREIAVNSISEISFVGPYRQQVDYRADVPLAQVVRRSQFDAALAMRAVGAGARLQTSLAVADVLREPGGMEVYCTPPGDPSARSESVRFRSRSLVVAVGYNVGLLGRLGLQAPRRFTQGVQWLCPLKRRYLGGPETRQVQVFLGRNHVPGSFAWAVPLERGWIKVGLTAKGGAVGALKRLLRNRLLKGRLDMARGRLKSSPIPLEAAPRTVADRIMVVGEAAGQVKTTSHGGIYYGMLGGRLAADVLGDALQTDDLSTGRLLEYDRRWRALLEPELDEGTRLRAAFERMSDLRLAGLMSLASVPSMMRMVRAYADFDWHRGLIEQISKRGWLGVPGRRVRKVTRGRRAADGSQSRSATQFT